MSVYKRLSGSFRSRADAVRDDEGIAEGRSSRDGRLRVSCDHRRKARYASIFREAQRLQVEHEEVCELCRTKLAA